MGFHAMAVRRNMLMNRATLMACTLAAGIACAQGQGAYPFKPIRIIVPYASGGGPDFTGREIARAITEGTGQPVVMDNRPGAGATLGHGIGAKAAPDGYTLTLGTIGGLVAGRCVGELGDKARAWLPVCVERASSLAAVIIRQGQHIARDGRGRNRGAVDLPGPRSGGSSGGSGDGIRNISACCRSSDGSPRRSWAEAG